MSAETPNWRKAFTWALEMAQTHGARYAVWSYHNGDQTIWCASVIYGPTP